MTDVGNHLAHWSKSRKDSSDDSDAYIPGVSERGRRRPSKSRMKARKTKEIKVKIPVKPTVFPIVTKSLTTQSEPFSESEASRQPRHSRTVSLKDLSAEDKLRVANLIKELSRVGEEKEKALNQLHEERGHFEKQLLQLISQQEQTLKEREEIQEKFITCQNLLTQYQAQILERHDHLNTSLTESVTEPTKKVRDSKDKRIQKKENEQNKSSFTLYDEEEQENQKPVQAPQMRELPRPNIPPADSEDDQPNFYNTNPFLSHQPANRPFTALIDREIAAEENKRRSKNPFLESDDEIDTVGRHHRNEMQYRNSEHSKPVLFPAPFREPIMSSTQKSNEIRANLSRESRTNANRMKQDAQFSPGSENSLPVPIGNNNGRRVDFAHDPVVSNISKKHSPEVCDKEYIKQYKKMSPGERKRELLQQRSSLLEEQRRLKQILSDQEDQLKSKQKHIERQQVYRQRRLEYFEKNGHFPTQNGRFLETLLADEEDPVERDFQNAACNLTSAEDELHALEEKQRNIIEQVSHTLDTAQEIRERTNQPTLPFAFGTKSSVGTSPIRFSDQCRISPLRDAATSISHLHTSPRDAATSISHRLTSPRSPLTDLTPKQANLAFQVNRATSKIQSVSPGEKTLSVLEIVNSIEKTDSPNSSFRTSGLRNIDHADIMSNLHRQELLDTDASEESVEESKILEDVFFLK